MQGAGCEVQCLVRNAKCLLKFSPTKVGAQVFRHQLRTKVRSMICFRLRD